MMDIEKKIDIAMKVADDEGISEESFVRSVIKAHVRSIHHTENAKDIESALLPEGRKQLHYVLNRLRINRMFR